MLGPGGSESFYGHITAFGLEGFGTVVAPDTDFPADRIVEEVFVLPSTENLSVPDLDSEVGFWRFGEGELLFHPLRPSDGISSLILRVVAPGA